MVELLGRGERIFLARRVVDEPVLPFAGLAVGAYGGIQRGVAGKPAVHRHDVALGHAETVRDGLHQIGTQIAFVQRLQLALRPPQVEESFFCAAVVPIFTRLHERRMYSWMEARIHHIA